MNDTYLGFSSDEIAGFVRHVIGGLGGAGIAVGGLDPTSWQTIAGALAAIAAVGWSVLSKRSAKTDSVSTGAK